MEMASPSLAGALEDSSPMLSFRESSTAVSEVFNQEVCPDPFADSQLQGFGLSSLGAALSVQRAAGGPSDMETSPWVWVCTGGKGQDLPRCLAHDKTRVFAPPSWPSMSQVGARATEEDGTQMDFTRAMGDGQAAKQSLDWYDYPEQIHPTPHPFEVSMLKFT